MADSITISGRPMQIDLSKPIDISIPLQFDGTQPNAYGVDPASSQPCEAGDLVGDTRRGGSCNFERYTFIPHCNGTHTECVGHITDERISVRDCLRDVFVPAVLVSIDPISAVKTNEGYSVAMASDDRVITRELLTSALSNAGSQTPIVAGGTNAIIIRTLPNDDSKLTRQYDSDSIPPYFTTEAMEYIVECGFKHLLVDMPSIDRLFDEGNLSNHRIFWKVEQGSRATYAATRIYSTITELIYVPNGVEDGNYLLNLQIAPFESDAAPSRPVLIKKN